MDSNGGGLQGASNFSKKGGNLHFDKSVLTCHHIQRTFEEIHSERTARLIGLIAHFVYWVTFGHINQLPLDNYHLKQLFISILQCVTQLELQQGEKKRVFTSFVMPMVLLAIRIEVEVIFHNNYPSFMAEQANDTLASRLINGAITEVLDPNLYYSRFSFLESGKDAIDIKSKIAKRTSPSGRQDPNMSPELVGANMPPSALPNGKNKYYTRSTLVKNLIPFPSEGRVRALFGEQPNFSLPKILNKGPRNRTQESGSAGVLAAQDSYMQDQNNRSLMRREDPQYSTMGTLEARHPLASPSADFDYSKLGAEFKNSPNFHSRHYNTNQTNASTTVGRSSP